MANFEWPSVSLVIYQQEINTQANLLGLSGLACLGQQIEWVWGRTNFRSVVTKKVSVMLTSWRETDSLFTCFLGLGVLMFGTGGESGTTGRGMEEETYHTYTSVCDVCTFTCVYTDRGKERMREETSWMLSISFCLSKSNFDILFNTLPKGGTFFFVFLHFGSQSTSSGLIQIYQA